MAGKRKVRKLKKSVEFDCGCCCPCHILPVIGFALIVAKATDYLTGCGKISSLFALFGIILLIVGKMMMKKCNCCN